jgi:YfiH family protein
MNYSFTNRTGGVSTGAFASLNMGLHVGDDPATVISNREVLKERLGPVQFMSQEHGNRIALIESVIDIDPVADSLVTGIPGINLAVQVADCIPLLLSSDQAVAAVHVGRKGLVNGVALRTLELMRELGASTISAIIGPAICGKCYEVSEEIFNEVVELHPTAAAKRNDGTFALDLPRALTSVLEREGVDVLHEGSCTVEDSQLFSYRRDGVTGRQVGVICL